MRTSVLAALLILGAVACNRSPLSPTSSLNGTWVGNLTRNWWTINLSLATAGREISGAGAVCSVPSAARACQPGSVTIEGQRTTTQFQLTVQRDSGFVATYSGQLVGENELRGIWVQGGRSDSVVFHRWTGGA